MRFLLKEQPYEKPIAAGALRYEREGQPTGAVEKWRYTHALDGYRFLRVDLDGRASSGDTFLYVLLFNAAGGLEDVRWRFYNGPHKGRGQLLFEADVLTAVRKVDGQRFEEERSWSTEAQFFFPTAVGLGLLRDAPSGRLWTLDMHQRQPQRFMALLDITAEVGRTGEQLTVQWGPQMREVWFNERGFVQQMVRQDGLSAVQSRFMDYQGG